MKKVIKILSLCLLMVYIASCGQNVNPGNQPYEPDSPAPDPHNGVFSSDYGTLTFNGDGETITVKVGPELSKLFEIDEGEYQGTYEFLSGDLPPNGSVPVRYDIAHELQINLDYNGTKYSKVFDVGIANEDGKSATVGLNMATPDRIPLFFKDNDNYFTVVFEKE